MKYLRILSLAIVVGLLGCDKEQFFSGTDRIEEGFEGISQTDELFESGNWTYFQQTEAGSFLEIDTTLPHSGNQCLKIIAAQGEISKSDIANNEMAFFEGEIVEMSAWFYLEDTLELGYVFLFDLEESVPIGAGPGIRIAIDDQGYLQVERNKYGESTLRQAEATQIPFPRNRWVELRLEVDLQQRDRGSITLWQDGVEIIREENTQTLPKDDLYFIQGTKGMYQSVQIGLTALTSDHDVTLYLDDVFVGVKE